MTSSKIAGNLQAQMALMKKGTPLKSIVSVHDSENSDYEEVSRTQIPTDDKGKLLWYHRINDIFLGSSQEIKKGIPKNLLNNEEVVILAEQYSFDKSEVDGETTKKTIEAFRFACFNDIEKAAEFSQVGIGKDRNGRHFFSRIQEHEPVRLYFDYDYEGEELKDLDDEVVEELENKHRDDLTDAIISAIVKITGIMLSSSDFLVFNSSRPGKISFHIESRNHYVKKNALIYPIVKEVSKTIPHIDTCVYKNGQNWRLYGSSKVNKNNIKYLDNRKEKIPENRILPQQIQGCSELVIKPEFIASSSGHIAEQVDLPQELEDIINEKIPDCRLETSSKGFTRVIYNGAMCPIHNTVHQRENGTIFSISGSWFFKCLRQTSEEKSLFLWKEPVEGKEEDQSKFSDEDFITHIQNDEKGYSDIILAFLKGDVIITDTERNIGYIWQPELKIWVKSRKTQLLQFVDETAGNYVRQFSKIVIENIEKSRPVTDESKKKKIQDPQDDVIRMITTFVKRINTIRFRTASFDTCKGFLYDEDFETRINRIANLFPTNDKRVIDLRTGKSEERKKEHLFTFELPFCRDEDPKTNERVSNFIGKLHRFEPEMIEYDRISTGYCLTGEISEKMFHILYGEGNNGKTTHFEIMEKLLGPWYASISPSALIQRGKKDNLHSGATTELNALIGKRYAGLSETQEGDRLNDTNIKRITGGDPQALRGLFEEEKKQTLFCKLEISTNEPLEFNSYSKAMMSRCRQVPYKAIFLDKDKYDETDPEFKDKTVFLKQSNEAKDLLTNHIGAFFNYYLIGAMQFYELFDQEKKMTIPKACIESLQECIDETDPIQRFIDEELIKIDESIITGRDLYNAYRVWHDSNGEQRDNLMSITSFGRKIKARIPCKRNKTGVVYLGYALNDNSQSF